MLQTELIAPVLEDVIAKAHIEGIAIPAQTEALKIIDRGQPRRNLLHCG